MKSDDELRRVIHPGPLRALSDEELSRYVEISDHTIAGGDILAEWYRRASARREETAGRLTRAIAGMTLVITIATIVNVILFALRTP